MDDDAQWVFAAPDSFRVVVVALQILGLVLILLLLGVTVAYHLYRHPVINALFIALLLHAMICIWPGIFDTQLRQETSFDLNVRLDTATSLILFCAADAVLDRYLEVVVAAFNVSIMLAILSQTRRALHADPQDITRGINPSQPRVESAWKTASLCFGPFIWAMPVLFVPLHHLTDNTSTLVVYSTLYCDIPDSTYRDLSLVFLLLPLLTAVIISLWIFRCIVLLYRRHRNTVSFSLYSPLGARFVAMALITLLSTILLVINASTRFATQALVGIIVFWEALAPILQFTVFASQPEVVAVWSNWIHFRFRTGSSGSSSYSAYSLRQFPNAVQPRQSTILSVRASRSLPPLPSEADTSNSNSDSNGTARPRRDASQVYQTIQLELPGSRLSIPPQLRNRTPTPTPQILAAAAGKAPRRSESQEDVSLFTPTSASDPLFSTGSSRFMYDSPELPPALPATNGSQAFYSRSAGPQFYPQQPVLPARHRSLPAQTGKRPLVLPATRGIASPYEIPPPPARPPPAPSSTTSRSTSFSGSSQWSQATAPSAHSRSMFTRFTPNAHRRSAPAPLRQPSMREVGGMREILAQFPPSPGSSAFPALPQSVPTAVHEQDSSASPIGPVLETIQISTPAPVHLAQRPATIDQSVRMPVLRNPVALADGHQSQPQPSASPTLPPLQSSVEPTATTATVAVSPGRSLTHDYPHKAHTMGGTSDSGSPFGVLVPSPARDNSNPPVPVQHLDLRRESAPEVQMQMQSSRSRRRSMSRSRPASTSHSLVGSNALPSVSISVSVSAYRDRYAPARDVPPVPSRPTSVATPTPPVPARTRPASLAPSQRVVRTNTNSPRSATHTVPPPAIPRSNTFGIASAPPAPRDSLPQPPNSPKAEYTRTWI